MSKKFKRALLCSVSAGTIAVILVGNRRRKAWEEAQEELRAKSAKALVEKFKR